MDVEDLVREIVAEGIVDPRVLEAFRRVPREAFVPPGVSSQAYFDRPLPIPRGQVTTQPSLVAKMVEGFALKGSETVLEVGTGYGYQTAILGRLASFVWSIERWADIAESARSNLRRLSISNVEVVVGDGTEGLAEHSPFDAIIVSAAFSRVPPPLAAQLKVGGRLVQPIGQGGDDEVMLFVKTPQGLDTARTLTLAHFVRLYGRHGFPVRSPGGREE